MVCIIVSVWNITNAKTDIKDLYLAGQWVFPGFGIAEVTVKIFGGKTNRKKTQYWVRIDFG
jgi:phytoene dehydrogenase-like protein